MKVLKEAIRKHGVVRSASILDVSSFLNGMVDPSLMKSIGEDFSKHFSYLDFDAYITVESSGIAPAVFAALDANKPLVIIKKSTELLKDPYVQQPCHSYTKGNDYFLSVKRHFVENKRFVLIDDFLATGAVVENVEMLLNSQESTLVGIGICVSKGFQNGYQLLESKGYNLYSQVIIESMNSELNEVVYK